MGEASVTTPAVLPPSADCTASMRASVTAMHRLLVDLRHAEMTCWTADQAVLDILNAVPDWEVVQVHDDDHRAEALAAGADAVWTWHLDPNDAANCPGLRWVSTPAAGADYLPVSALTNAGLRVSVSHGHHGPAMAEHVMGMILSLARRLDLAPARQAAGDWWRAELDAQMIDLLDARLVIAGYGAIGQAVAARATAFGMRVIGLARNARPADAYGVATVGTADHAATLHQARVVVNCLPGNPTTNAFLSRSRLASLATPAIVINVGRGSTIDESALAEFASMGRIRAGLDVTAVEPLPADAALRSTPNVLITPHASAVTAAYLTRAAVTQAEQMRRFTAGDQLQHVVSGGEHEGMQL